jgi:hypothetical protein
MQLRDRKPAELFQHEEVKSFKLEETVLPSTCEFYRFALTFHDECSLRNIEFAKTLPALPDRLPPPKYAFSQLASDIGHSGSLE